MKLLVGQTRSEKHVALMNAETWGEVVTPREKFPRRCGFGIMADNGAFEAWRKGEPFDEVRFGAFVERFSFWPERPNFLVVPDIVAGGMESLTFSYKWQQRLSGICVPLYLAVQDGMTPANVGDLVQRFDGVFVGGSLIWKLITGEMWCAWASSLGKPCHIGRVGTAIRVRWARACGATSADSCTPLFSDRNRETVAAAMREVLAFGVDHYLATALKFAARSEGRMGWTGRKAA